MQNPPPDRKIDAPMPHIDAAHMEAMSAGMQDSTRKTMAAPVDTVRLKNDMNADKHAMFRLQDMTNGTANARAATDFSRAADNLAGTVAARADTLKAVRKGKLPAAKED